jgi:acetyl-CoA carboxylase biotin carboxyl carrier protein
MARAPAQKAATRRDAATKPAIDTDLVRTIALLLKETDVGEIEVAKGDLKIRVARQIAASAASFVAATAAAPSYVASAPAASAPAMTPSAAHTAPLEAAEAAAHPGAVNSPMVGTAYRKPSPDAKNFVEVGSVVKAGDKLMLIEAMKTFNDIVAPRAGTISAVLIEDGQPVEFGQTLFVID